MKNGAAAVQEATSAGPPPHRRPQHAPSWMAHQWRQKLTPSAARTSSEPVLSPTPEWAQGAAATSDPSGLSQKTWRPPTGANLPAKATRDPLAAAKWRVHAQGRGRIIVAHVCRTASAREQAAHDCYADGCKEGEQEMTGQVIDLACSCVHQKCLGNPVVCCSRWRVCADSAGACRRVSGGGAVVPCSRWRISDVAASCSR